MSRAYSLEISVVEKKLQEEDDLVALVGGKKARRPFTPPVSSNEEEEEDLSEFPYYNRWEGLDLRNIDNFADRF